MAAAGMSEGEKRYPLHRLVWDNRYQELDEALKKKEDDAEEVDVRGRCVFLFYFRSFLLLASLFRAYL